MGRVAKRRERSCFSRRRVFHKFPREFISLKKSIAVAMLFFWRRHPDLNRGIKVLQTLALPLGYSALTSLFSVKAVSFYHINVRLSTVLYYVRYYFFATFFRLPLPPPPFAFSRPFRPLILINSRNLLRKITRAER